MTSSAFGAKAYPVAKSRLEVITLRQIRQVVFDIVADGLVGIAKLGLRARDGGDRAAPVRRLLQQRQHPRLCVRAGIAWSGQSRHGVWGCWALFVATICQAPRIC